MWYNWYIRQNAKGGEKMIWEDMSYNRLDLLFALQIEEEQEVEYKAEEEEEDI